MDLNLLCRLCAKEDRLCIQVFGTEGLKQNVAKKIRLCLPIVVKECDDFPKQICLNCLSNLDTSYELYTRCLEAQSVIKNVVMLNRQNSGEVVKVYSTQELLKMVSKLRNKMCEKQPAVVLGNTVFTVQDGSGTKESSNDDQRAMKHEVMKTSGMSIMYSSVPISQQYMQMPSAMMVSSAAPGGQFAVAPLPTAQSYAVSSAQAVPQTPVSTSSAVQTNNADIQILTPKTSLTEIGAFPSSTVQSIQHVSCIQNFQSPMSSQVSAPNVQQASVPIVTSAPPELQITSVQSLSEMTSELASVQFTVEALPEIATIQTNMEESPSDILPLITSDALGPKELLSASSNVQQASTQRTKKLQSQKTPLMVNMEGGNDDDRYAADDPDPLHVNSEDEEQDKTKEETATDSTVTRNVNDGRVNKHKCPYCDKSFPEDLILHHKNLHFRQKFFSCVLCNKNFQTAAGLESHHCE